MAGGLDWKPMAEFNGEPDVQYLFRVEWNDPHGHGKRKPQMVHYYDAGEWRNTGYGAEVTGMGNTYDLDKGTGRYVYDFSGYDPHTLTHFAVINEPEV